MMIPKRSKYESREDIIRSGREGQWVYYIDKWWKIIERTDWVSNGVIPVILLRRRYMNKEYYLGI